MVLWGATHLSEPGMPSRWSGPSLQWQGVVGGVGVILMGWYIYREGERD